MTDLEHILCHRHPMIFLDDIVAAGHGQLIARVRIRDGLPFFETDRGVPAWVGLEYMAQSIAALAGQRARDAGKPVPLGLIIGCRRYDCTTSAFAPGHELQISVTELAAEEYGFGSFDCDIDDRGRDPAGDCGEQRNIVARARVSVFGGDRQLAA